MLIRFQNLGKIKDTELDLRPLTVIIGPNNSNKTYLAYSIYGLWQALSVPYFPISEAVMLDSMGHGVFSLKVNQNLYDKFKFACIESTGYFSRNLEYFYQDSSGQVFSKTKIDVELSWEELLEALKYYSGKYLAFADARYRMVYEQDVLSFYPELTPQEEGRKGVTIRDFSEMEQAHILAYNFQTALFLRIFPQPFLLPAERNALVITYKLLANRRLKLLRDERRQAFRPIASAQRQLEALRGVGEFRYPQPVEDFLDFLSDVELESGRVNKPKAPDNAITYGPRSAQEKKKFDALAGLIEKQIQNANRTTFHPATTGGKEMMVQVDKDLRIDLYNASSSIKQLAPLLLYLRYRARDNDLLIMDEPEMNLHPESQAKLLEVLAMLVNNGIRVLLTTHSPYVMAHLNNLAQGGPTAAARKRQAKALFLQNPDALLRMDQVGAYEMRDNQLHSLKDPDYGIRWDTLSDVSGELQQKFFQIYEEGHAQDRAKPTRPTAKTAGK